MKLIHLLFCLVCLSIISCKKENHNVYIFSDENVVLTQSWIQEREQLDIDYLRSLDPDRLLHNFRINAGISSKANPLTGWESPSIGLRGHFVGHYLSAVSSVVGKYRDTELSHNLDYIIDELAKCQEKLGKGYLSAFPESEFSNLENGLSNVWAPYYTYHKIMQGLYDVYVDTGNRKAFDILIKMADYVVVRMKCLDDKTISKMLYTTQANPVNEPGGMNEILYKVYDLTKNMKYLETAKLFDRDWFLKPLADGKDILSGLHSNTHIAIVNGFAECYSVTGDTRYFNAVCNFWNMLVLSHSYANCSSSGPRPNVTTPTSLTSEHWGVPGHLSNTLTGYIAESCVSHNFMRLTSRLFQWTQDPKYADAYMNAFYNSIMALQNKDNGEYVYHLPLGSPRQKKFLSNQFDFRCCNGSSIESFSRLNENIYFHRENSLWINLYTPSELNWDEYNLKISQSSDLIRDRNAEIRIMSDSFENIDINLFIPSWAEGAEIFVNNEFDGKARKNSYYKINRIWKKGDIVKVKFPFNFRTVCMPDDKNVISIFHGPVLLAVISTDEIILDGDINHVLDNINETEKYEYVLNNGGKSYYLIPLFEVVDETYSVYLRTNKL